MNHYDLVHDLLTAAEHRPVTDAVAAYDAARAAQVDHRPPPHGQRHKVAEAALRAEHAAAVAENREPKLTAATLTAADEAATDDRLRGDALAQDVQRRMAALDAAVAASGAQLWHTIAVARAEALQADPGLDTLPAAIEALWPQLHLPALYCTPALVQTRGFARWNKPDLHARGIYGGQASNLAAVRQQWDAHLWAQLALAEGRGWRLDDDGTLRLLTPWPTGTTMRPVLVDAPEYRPANTHRIGIGGEPLRAKLHDGDLTWVGHGPGGERGATVDDIAGHLHPAGMT